MKPKIVLVLGFFVNSAIFPGKSTALEEITDKMAISLINTRKPPINLHDTLIF